MKRGVVALPFEVQKSEQGFKLGEAVSAEQLNYFALYWDEIVIPRNYFINAHLPNEDVFEGCGLLTRPTVDIRSGINISKYPEFHLMSQVEVIELLREIEKTTDWSIHQTGDNPLLFANGSVSKQTVRLELQNLLPVPGNDVHLHEILEFKQRRAAELEALRSYCDELYFEIINSGDPRLQAAKTFTKLKQAIEDLDKLNAQGWRSPIKFDLDISSEFNLSDCRAGIATIISAFATPHVFETVSTGAVIAVLEGFVNIKTQLQSMRNGRNENLAYISKARREGVLM